MDSLTGIETALDERHAAARAAFARRDLNTYRDLFSPDLAYRQLDGRIIDRERLMRDVAAQFSRLGRVESGFVREDLVVDCEEVSETLLQTASAVTTAFGFVRRTRRLERRGRYTWKVVGGLWTIVRVEVLHERVRGSWSLRSQKGQD